MCRFAKKKRDAQKSFGEEEGEKDALFSPRRKATKYADAKVIAHEMISKGEFKKHCEAGKIEYGKKNKNRKHLETILVVSIVDQIGRCYGWD